MKQDNLDPAVLSGAQHLASSGRTSFPVDKAVPRDAYRMLGYRQCGERAVRVDILERLADLIRPALAWRENASGEKPAGAFDGRGFVVTQAMTSLTGSAGEDFASVLRALGYRMDRRPPLPPKPVVVETPAAEAAPAEAAEAPAEAAAEAPAEVSAEIVDQAVSGDPAPSAALLPEVTPLASSEETPVVIEAQPEPAAVAEPVAEAAPTAEAAPETASVEAPAEGVAEAAAEAAAPAEAATTEAAAETPAEPQLVEVWRPGGRSEERRPRHENRNRHRHGKAPQQDGAQAAPAGEGQAADGQKRERPRHHGRGNRDFRKPRENAPGAEAAPAVAATTDAAAASAPAGEQRQEARPEQHQGQRPDHGDRRDRTEGKGRDRDRDNKREKFGNRQGERREDRGRDRDKGRDKRDRESGPALRPYASSQNPRERDRPADPNSPFAKLAALREQLAGNRKE